VGQVDCVSQLTEGEVEVMQRLQFELAWDKTIASLDRKFIERVFSETNMDYSDGILFTFLREATNHKGDLLVTVLIHNCFERKLSMEEITIAYRRGEKAIAIDTFTLPFEINAKTTMPWTFIYSQPYSTEGKQDYEINWTSHNK